MLRDLIALDLKDAGATVIVAQDGQEAIEKLENLQPDLILLDLLMPRKDGFAVLQHLREGGRALPVVMLSNLSSSEEKDKCRVLGARDFIIKSELDTGDLWGKIKKHL